MGAFGLKFLFSFTKKISHHFRTIILVFIILVPFFLFQTEFVYTFTGDSSESLPLLNWKMNPTSLYGVITTEQDVKGAQWVSRNMVDGIVFADDVKFLNSYGLLYGRAEEFTNTTYLLNNQFVFMRQLNNYYGIVSTPLIGTWNTSIFSSLNDQNKVFSDGGCEIYRSVG